MKKTVEEIIEEHIGEDISYVFDRFNNKLTEGDYIVLPVQKGETIDNFLIEGIRHNVDLDTGNYLFAEVKVLIGKRYRWKKAHSGMSFFGNN